MPEREWRQRVRDMIDAIIVVQRYVDGMTFDMLGSEPEKTDAILFRLSVIGEAVSHIPKEIRERHAHIPWKDIRDMRNVISHVYWGIDLSIIWNTVQEDLPELLSFLERLIREEE